MVLLKPPFDVQESVFVEHIFTAAAAATTSAAGGANNGPAVRGTAPSNVLDLVLPATYNLSRTELGTIDSNVPQSLASFIANELDVTRLNKIHKHLWWAGLERPARALHHQRSTGRDIVVTEQVDLHLLWKGTRIYVKPLPDFLMCHSMWETFICPDALLHERASGFLLSYLWLVCHRSDLRVAHECGLIPLTVTWERWTAFATTVATKLDYKTFNGINIRYRYGELRLDRINWIYGLCSKSISFATFTRGYRHGYYDYDSFIQRNLAWLISALIYIGLVLTAMQVGLATNFLRDNTAFQRASYGFTIFSIVAPLVIVVGILTTVIMLFADNMRYTLQSKRNWSSSVAIDFSKH